jgi:hydrogenase expression/formation protein HypC
VKRRDGDFAVVDLHGNRLRVSTFLTPHVAEGDWVLVHAGFALHQMSPGDARMAFSILSDPAATAEEEGTP